MTNDQPKNSPHGRSKHATNGIDQHVRRKKKKKDKQKSGQWNACMITNEKLEEGGGGYKTRGKEEDVNAGEEKKKRQ